MLCSRALHISTVDGSGLVYVCILRTDLFATGATTYIRYSCRARLAERRGGVLYPVMMSEVALKSVHVLPVLLTEDQ